jgi:hypothetical protein
MVREEGVTDARTGSARALGIAVALLTVALWAGGFIPPPHPRIWTALDLRWYFFPQYDAFYGSVRDGAPMLWNPYQLCGMPVLGTLQSGFFYPLHVLYLALPTGWALATSTALHLALAAGACAAFARRAGLSSAAAALAGIVFATTGAMRHWLLWPYLFEASAWLPVGAIGVLDITGNRGRRGALLLAAGSGASWLAGGPQATVFSVYVWVALAAVRLLFDGTASTVPARSRGRSARSSRGGCSAPPRCCRRTSWRRRAFVRRAPSRPSPCTRSWRPRGRTSCAAGWRASRGCCCPRSCSCLSRCSPLPAGSPRGPSSSERSPCSCRSAPARRDFISTRSCPRSAGSASRRAPCWSPGSVSPSWPDSAWTG